MIYPYRCSACEKNWEVSKSMKDATRPETCECGTIGQRIYSAEFFFNGVSAREREYEYNPAFGKWVCGKKQRDELAKRHGMIEIGNEDPNKIYDNFAKERERKADAAWEKV